MAAPGIPGLERGTPGGVTEWDKLPPAARACGALEELARLPGSRSSRGAGPRPHDGVAGSVRLRFAGSVKKNPASAGFFLVFVRRLVIGLAAWAPFHGGEGLRAVDRRPCADAIAVGHPYPLKPSPPKRRQALLLSHFDGHGLFGEEKSGAPFPAGTTRNKSGCSSHAAVLLPHLLVGEDN